MKILSDLILNRLKQMQQQQQLFDQKLAEFRRNFPEISVWEINSGSPPSELLMSGNFTTEMKPYMAELNKIYYGE